MISANADGRRAGEFSHAVEHAHSNGNFGRLGIGLYRLGLSGHGFATQAASLRVAA
ncbi:MAG: hypothetical protein VB143_04595 [Burkholderia sp.]